MLQGNDEVPGTRMRGVEEGRCMAANNLYLIGYRATGKTTVAQRLGLQLDRPMVDADDLIEARAGMPIKDIFAEAGEDGFRDVETAVINDLSQRGETVVALGGGAVLRKQNRQLLQNTGPMVWLQASADTILERIQGDPTTTDRRPNLTHAGGLQEIQELLSDRELVYQECADHCVDTEGKSPGSVADAIYRWVIQYWQDGNG